MKGKCQYFACPDKAVYGLFHTVGDAKAWKRVCPYHERQIGHENLMRRHEAKRKAISLSDSPS